MSDEAPFITADEPAFDAWLDFRRTLELTGERWLLHSEAIDLLRKREPVSIGRAEAILDDLRERYFAGERTGVRWHWFRDDGLLSKPTRGNTFVSEADLIYWHDQIRTPQPPAPIEAPSQPKLQHHRRKAKILQDAAEQRLLSVFAASYGIPPASLRPKDILERVNQGLSPGRQFLRDTVTRAVKSLKEKAKQNH
jgi:hypothetical protein